MATAALPLPLNPPPRRRLNRAQQRMRSRLIRDHERLSKPFATELVELFAQLGREAAQSFRAIQEAKDADEGEILDAVEQVIGGMNVSAAQADFVAIGAANYLKISQRVFDVVSTEFSLSIGMPDTVAQEILAEGGKHMGLVDLDKQTREALFSVLEKAREDGLGIPEIERRIRNKIPAGRYTTTKIRARLIARTETKHAQRTSTIRAYKQSGVVQQVIIIDAVIGNTDEECMFWNGRTVTLAHAVELGNQEHPNGTRDFVPIIV